MNDMKKCYLDTNILIALKIEDSPHHAKTRKLIEVPVKEEINFYISPLTVDEFLHPMKYFLGLKYRNVFPYLNQVLKEILMLPSVNLINPSVEIKAQLQVIQYMEDYRLRPRDAYHLFIMQTNRIDLFATFDTDFNEVFKKGLVKKYRV